MDNYSWIAPSVKNMADAFGLNPKLAAEGRKLQSEREYLDARTRNTNEDTALMPYRRGELQSRSDANTAQAGNYKASAGKTEEETRGIEFTNKARKTLSDAFASGAFTMNQDGSMSINADSVNKIAQSLAALSDNPEIVMNAMRGLQGNAAGNARAAAQARGFAAAFGPRASFSAQEGRGIVARDAADAFNRATGVAQIGAQSRENVARIAAGAKGAQGEAGAVDQAELNRQMEAVNKGAEWASETPLLGSEGYLSKGQALRVAQAARNAYPNMNIQDAIVLFMSENKDMFTEDSDWGKNDLNIVKPFPEVRVPTPAAAAAPAPTLVAPRSAASEIGLPASAADVFRVGPRIDPMSAGSVVPQIVPSAPSSTPPLISNDEYGRKAYESLAPGTRFFDPNGVLRIKP